MSAPGNPETMRQDAAEKMVKTAINSSAMKGVPNRVKAGAIVTASAAGRIADTVANFLPTGPK